MAEKPKKPVQKQAKKSSKSASKQDAKPAAKPNPKPQGKAKSTTKASPKKTTKPAPKTAVKKAPVKKTSAAVKKAPARISAKTSARTTTVKSSSPNKSAATGRITSDDRTWGTLVHLSVFLGGFLGPLIVWIVKKDTSKFVDQHGRAALSFGISLFIYFIVIFWLVLTLLVSVVGITILPAMSLLMISLGVYSFVIVIIAAIKANKGESFRYPLAIPFL